MIFQQPPEGTADAEVVAALFAPMARFYRKSGIELPEIEFVDGTEFELITEGEWAWPATEGEDLKVVAAMKRGTEAVLTARSERGTQTKDTFSLLGFTAALAEAEKRCSS